MNSVVGRNMMRFVVLILLQVLVLNKINFLGYINPYAYILFILLYPINNNRMLFIFLSFLLGLTIDLFSDSGGVHAAACVFAAYARPFYLKTAFGMMYEHQTVKISNSELGQRLTYIALLAFIHHLVLFFLEVFNMTQILLIIKKTLFSGLFTVVLCLLLTIIFSRKSR